MKGPDDMTRFSGPRRWHEQRWLIDSVIRTEGLEWDQPRIAYTLRAMGVDATPDFAVAISRGRHALPLPTQAVASGPNWSTYSADWLLDQETSA
jgi:hypothetical protein